MIYLLINLPYLKTKNRYVVLTNKVFNKCSQGDTKFCDFGTAIRHVSDVIDTCLFSMLLKQESKNCAIKMYHDGTPYPKGFSIGKGKWAVASKDDLVFTILCLDDSEQKYQLKPPIGLITLPLGCKGYSTAITLPSYYVHEQPTYIHQINPLPKPNMTIYESSDSSELDDPIVNYKLPDKINMISSNDQSVQSVVRRLHRQAWNTYDFQRRLKRKRRSWKNILLVTFAGVLGGVVLVAFLVIKFRLYRYFGNFGALQGASEVAQEVEMVEQMQQLAPIGSLALPSAPMVLTQQRLPVDNDNEQKVYPKLSGY